MATYRFKVGEKHTGYVENFVETSGGDITIITQYSYEQNIHAEHDFCQEMIHEMGYQGVRTTLLAYGA
ncbi:hypothetical protein CE91St56_06770 [Lachnospiraceae bacterium]|nr:hypothetical protein CE91St56_06770 [Lachnospiraceae bacterium]GKH45417.1 hypothetical protein CE91St57_63910 [Lachnospiraceae bacterium]